MAAAVEARAVTFEGPGIETGHTERPAQSPVYGVPEWAMLSSETRTQTPPSPARDRFALQPQSAA